MRSPIRKVILFVNRDKRGVQSMVEKISDLLQKRKIKVRVVDDNQKEATGPRAKRDLMAVPGSLIITVGGDGTLLQAARRSLGTKAPLIGVNAGSLGFLTSVSREKAVESLERVLDGGFEISPRFGVAAKVRRNKRIITRAWALNEAAISRGSHSHMVRLKVHINGHLLSDYLCDGLLVATPTGSTAYSLSAGGPVLAPESGALVITPICAHSLTNRPVIVDGNEPISVSIPDHSAPLQLATDGVICSALLPGDRIELERDPTEVRLAHLPENGFYEVLRQKLRWSGTTH